MKSNSKFETEEDPAGVLAIMDEGMLLLIMMKIQVGLLVIQIQIQRDETKLNPDYGSH